MRLDDLAKLNTIGAEAVITLLVELVAWVYVLNEGPVAPVAPLAPVPR